jgi:hypothetical protein
MTVPTATNVTAVMIAASSTPPLVVTAQQNVLKLAMMVLMEMIVMGVTIAVR